MEMTKHKEILNTTAIDPGTTISAEQYTSDRSIIQVYILINPL